MALSRRTFLKFMSALGVTPLLPKLPDSLPPAVAEEYWDGKIIHAALFLDGRWVGELQEITCNEFLPCMLTGYTSSRLVEFELAPSFAALRMLEPTFNSLRNHAFRIVFQRGVDELHTNGEVVGHHVMLSYDAPPTVRVWVRQRELAVWTERKGLEAHG